MKDVKIDYGQKWVKDHWRSITTAYGNAPFFEHFEPYFHDVYYSRPKFLVDLNFQLIALCNKLLNLQTTLSQTDQFNDHYPEVDIDSRNLIHPKRRFKTTAFYKPCNYNQIFGKKFVANLSIIDLLFCEGPEAAEILIKSKA